MKTSRRRPSIPPEPRGGRKVSTTATVSRCCMQWRNSPCLALQRSKAASIATHGYLTLALVAPLQMEIGAVPTDAGAAFNYGLDKVRFLAPVKAGDRVRLRVALVNVEQKSGGVLLKTSNTLEIEGSDKPALVAESLALITPRKPV
jgi:acyl dehydratase